MGNEAYPNLFEDQPEAPTQPVVDTEGIAAGGRKSNPNARRAGQLEGAGGGFADAVKGELKTSLGLEIPDPKLVKVGDYDSKIGPIKNDTQAEQARGIDESRREVVARKIRGSLSESQKAVNEAGFYVARATLKAAKRRQ